MKDEELLAEVEDVIRTTPPQSAFMEQENDEVLRWLGRAAAVLEAWDPIRSVRMGLHISALQARPTKKPVDPDLVPEVVKNYSVISESLALGSQGPAYRELRTLLFRAQYDLRMKTVGPLSVAIDAKQPFAYFDEIRKIMALALEDLLFVDPYLDAEFVSTYLPQVSKGVTVRLLASKKIAALVAAVKNFVEEYELQVQVRSVSSGLHDRFVFVDKQRCYQSGASFKDGARRSPTALIQITDIFEVMQQGYETMWNRAETKFPRFDPAK